VESGSHSPGPATEFIEIADEYFRVPNSLVEQLARVRLKPHDYQVIFFIMRKTLGWAKNRSDSHLRKKADVLALSQLSDGTCLDRRRVHEALIRLRGRHIIVVHPSADRKAKTYGINFALSEWSLSVTGRTGRQRGRIWQRVRNGEDSLSGRERTDLSALGRTNLSGTSALTKGSPKETKESLKEETHGAFKNQENNRKSLSEQVEEVRAQIRANRR